MRTVTITATRNVPHNVGACYGFRIRPPTFNPTRWLLAGGGSAGGWFQPEWPVEVWSDPWRPGQRATQRWVQDRPGVVFSKDPRNWWFRPVYSIAGDDSQLPGLYNGPAGSPTFAPSIVYTLDVLESPDDLVAVEEQATYSALIAAVVVQNTPGLGAVNDLRLKVNTIGMRSIQLAYQPLQAAPTTMTWGGGAFASINGISFSASGMGDTAPDVVNSAELFRAHLTRPGVALAVPSGFTDPAYASGPVQIMPWLWEQLWLRMNSPGAVHQGTIYMWGDW